MNEVIPAADVKAPVIYTDLAQRAQARALLEAAKVLLERSAKYEAIPSDADVEVASEFRARLNATINALDNERLATTEDARRLVEQINAQANAVLTPMRAVLKKVDKAMTDYRAQKEAERQAAIRAQQEEAARLEREKAEAERKEQEAREAAAKATDAAERLRLIAEANEAASQLEAATVLQEAVSRVVAEAPQPKSIMGVRGSRTTFTDCWKWRLVDISLVPESYLLPPEERLDRKLLNAAAKSKKDKFPIPGIEIYNEPVTGSRVSK